MRNAYNGFDIGAEGEDDDDTRMFHRKIKSAIEHLQDENAKVHVLSSCLVTEPGDHLSQTLQHLDNDCEEWSLLDLVRERAD